MGQMNIGRLARCADVAIDTVRYYERNQLLSLSEERSVRKAKRAAEARLADIERRLAELQRIRDGLKALVVACPGHGRADECPILNALNEETPA